jgi:WD40 repeat protein
VPGVPLDRTGRSAYGQVSPDGQWLAYASNESARFEIYVQSFPTPGGGKWLISKDGVTMSTRALQESRELALDGDEVQAGNVTWLEFDQDVDVAVRSKIVAKHRAEQG